ncbi:MAG TPA: MFS transporter [Streptosporangiaceae bacterium]|nr:MFS transporter [Streptosporangiaceae bacterium]
MATTSKTGRARAGTKFVLSVLAAGQFLMTLDSSVMNVSIRQVAADLGTTVTGIQMAITLYTLVMASLMITGGKVGAIAGRRRAFAIGLIIYGAGSLTTALSVNLGMLLAGWSLLEGVGAALIMPAIVALVAGNFPAERRSAAYGMIAAAGAVAVAAGPLIGGAVTTFASWRWVFAAEDVIVLLILLALRKVADAPPTGRTRFDLVGGLLSIAGLALLVFGALKSGTWGFVKAKPGGPELLGTSPCVWLVIGGLLVLYGFFLWESRVEHRGGEPLVRPSMLRNSQLVGGLSMFFFQFFIQAGIFFTIPLFLSVVLELSALQTGARLLPLSAALLITAVGIPRLAPRARPRLIVRLGLLSMTAGTLVLIGGISPGADAGIVAIPMLLIGLGIGALASQLGAVTVSALPDSQSTEVGGLQNTVTSLGASLGTALVGAVLISSLTTGLIQGVQDSSAIPPDVKTQATTQFAPGVPFISDTDLMKQLQQGEVRPAQADAILTANSDARLAALRTSLWVVALFAVAALFCTGLIPVRPVGKLEADAAERTSPAG